MYSPTATEEAGRAGSAPLWAVGGAIDQVPSSPWTLVASSAAGAGVAGGLVLRGVRLARRASWWCMDPAGISHLPARHRSAVLRAADDWTLCRLWTRTGAALAASPSREVVETYVVARSEILDELERRHPAAFAAWYRTPDAHDLGRLLTPGASPDR